MKQNQNIKPEKLAQLIIEGIQDKKAHQIVSLDLSDIPNAVSKFFIICHGTSTTQVEAIVDAAIEKVKKNTGENPWHTEGYENAEWILIDYVNVVLHVFLQSVREFYKLEELWADAVIEHISSDNPKYV